MGKRVAVGGNVGREMVRLMWKEGDVLFMSIYVTDLEDFILGFKLR